MEQIDDLSDSRLQGFCVYCGGPPESRDHVPSIVFLDEPVQGYRPEVDACINCNRSFSKHEEYMACFLEAVRVGSTTPVPQVRPKIQKILAKRPNLASRIEKSKNTDSGRLVWEPEFSRIEHVVLKLARGHAAYELSAPLLDAPSRIVILPLLSLNSEQLLEFEQIQAGELWPEVGSRAMQRMAKSWPSSVAEWLVVQPDRYRYIVSIGHEITVRMVIGEYLSCEVAWELTDD
jgi:hypothetical protein